VLSPDSELLSADLVLLSENDFRRFFEYPAGHFTDIALSVANPQEVRNIAAKLSSALPDSRPILREEVLRTYQSVFDWREGIVLTVLAGAILALPSSPGKRLQGYRPRKNEKSAFSKPSAGKPAT
jgi:ABC-type lipoprotein release transport system permease subunit